MKASALALLTTAVVWTAAAAERWTTGDVVRTDEMQMYMCPMVPPTPAVYTRELVFKDWLYVSTVLGFDGAGSLHYLTGDALAKMDREPLIPTPNAKLPEWMNALAVDAAGSSYLVGTSGRLYVYSPANARLRDFALPNATRPAWGMNVDVSPDGCTFLYVGDTAAVNRFDVCRGAPLPAVAEEEHFTAVRALADGGFAGATRDRIRFYDASGRLRYEIQAPATPVAAMAFDVDPEYLWVATAQQLVRVRIQDGKITTVSERVPVQNVAVVGERRPSAASLPAAPPPRRRGAGH